MNIEEDYFYERMRKEVILRPEDASLKQEGHERHSRGKDINETSVKVSNISIKYVHIRLKLSNCIDLDDPLIHLYHPAELENDSHYLILF